MANAEEPQDPSSSQALENYIVYGDEMTFGEMVQNNLRNSPWFVASAVIHAFIIMIFTLMADAPEPIKNPEMIRASIPVKPQQVLEEPPKSEVKADKNIKDDTQIEEPKVTDKADIKDETDNDEEFEQAKGEPDAFSDADLTNDNNLDAIGVGGGSGSHFGGRLGGKQDRVKSGGGSTATENAVIDALRWLKRHQSPDGSWDVDGYTAHCDPMFGQKCDGVGSVKEGDPGVTGLALLAYLGAGYTHDDGTEFADTVRNGLKYLKGIQDGEGYFAAEKTSHFYMYGHAIATLAMTEAYGLTGQELFKGYAERGIDVIVRAQNDHPDKPGEKYGWRYYPKDGDNDTSVSGWMIMALKSAKACELHVPEEAFHGMENWVDFVTDDVYYRAGYQSPGGASALPVELQDKFRSTETTTAISILSRIFIGQRPTLAAIKAGAGLLLQDLPVWNEQDGSIDYYYWYYGTLAMFQVGGESWKDWNKAMKTSLVDHQLKRNDGCQWGSWNPNVDKWSGRGSRVYATAINCLTLEVYYRYDKVFK